MKYKAICFDIDGTLYPFSLMQKRLTRIWLRHPVFITRYNRMRKTFRIWQKDYKQQIPLRWREAMIIQSNNAQEPDKKFAESDYRKTYESLKRKMYDPMERLYSKTVPFDGVRETFKSIKAHGLKIGVFTDFPMYKKLQSMKLDEYVDFGASSDDTGFLKPDAHCFDYLLYNLKMEPSDVLYVGDSYEKDVVGAHNAGIDAVLVNVKPSDLRDAKEKYPLAKEVFGSWKEFDAWLASGMEDR
jgi:putative hydrolase of the HAD superfamily